MKYLNFQQLQYTQVMIFRTMETSHIKSAFVISGRFGSVAFNLLTWSLAFGRRYLTFFFLGIHHNQWPAASEQ